MDLQKRVILVLNAGLDFCEQVLQGTGITEYDIQKGVQLLIKYIPFLKGHDLSFQETGKRAKEESPKLWV
jgi:hypothetical protein